MLILWLFTFLWKAKSSFKILYRYHNPRYFPLSTLSFSLNSSVHCLPAWLIEITTILQSGGAVVLQSGGRVHVVLTMYGVQIFWDGVFRVEVTVSTM